MTTLTPEERAELVTALTFADLAEGKGSSQQVEAYRELEWRRCKASPIYFMERYSHIIVGGRIVKWHDPDKDFDIWPIQRKIVLDMQLLSVNAKVNGVSDGIAGVKSRQLGITTITSNFNYWDCMFHEATSWDLFSHSEEKAKDIIKRVQPTHLRVPSWMKERAQARETVADGKVQRGHKSASVTKFTFGLSEMKIQTSTAKNIQGASANIVIDEATLHADLDDKIDQAVATADGAMGIVVLIANGKGQEAFYRMYQAAKRGENGFLHYFFWWGTAPHRLKDTIITIDGVDHPVEEFLDPVGDPTSERVRKLAETGLKDGSFKCPWYERMKSKYIRDPEQGLYKFMAIYPTTEEEAFFITGHTRFNLELVNRILEGVKEEGHNYRRGTLETTAEGVNFRPLTTGHLRLYEKPDPKGRYVIGADPSGGGRAGDYGVHQVFKIAKEGVEQVAVYQAKVEPALFAYELERLGHYYNDALLVIEANNHGGTVIDNVKDGYFNLYMRKRFKNRYITPDSSDIGFWTDTTSKTKLIDQLATWLEDYRILIHDENTVIELSRYQQDPDKPEKTAAPKGANDDLVMALALAVEGAVDIETNFVQSEIRVIMPWE